MANELINNGTANITVGETITLINDSLTKYVVTPLNAFGLGGFVFDIEGDTTINLAADITDHYLADNTAVQDHIAIKPKKVVLRNYVGELVYRRDETTNTPLQRLTQKLTTITSFLPKLAAGAEQAKAFLEDSKSGQLSLKAVQDSTADLWALIKNAVPPTQRQAQAYMFFKALMEQKIFVSVQTPFEFMSKMSIESVAANQPEESKYISTFTITLKEIRTVAVQDVPYKPDDLQGRAVAQRQSVTQNGNLVGQDTAKVTGYKPIAANGVSPPYVDAGSIISDGLQGDPLRLMQQGVDLP